MSPGITRLLVFLVITMLLMPLVAYSSPDALLAELGVELKRIRASQSDQPVSSGLKPNVKVLAKIKRTQIQSALGAPDSCSERKSSFCANAQEWRYLFHKLPVSWRGGGAELVLSFDRNLVRDAQWIYSR